MKCIGWKCDLTGDVYGPNDSRLSGYGNPPSSPGAQLKLSGQGTFPMRRELIDMGELPAEQAARVPENMRITDTTEEEDA